MAGFLSKHAAHDILRGFPSGTFILRFSDSELGGVSVAYVNLMENGELLLLKCHLNSQSGMKTKYGLCLGNAGNSEVIAS